MNLLEIFAQVGEGMGNSILIFVLTLVFSLPLGLLVAFGRMNRWAPLAGLKRANPPFGGRRRNSGRCSSCSSCLSPFAGHPADAAADGGLLWALLYL